MQLTSLRRCPCISKQTASREPQDDQSLDIPRNDIEVVREPSPCHVLFDFHISLLDANCSRTNYSSDVPLLVIFHDPYVILQKNDSMSGPTNIASSPEVIGVSDPLTRKLDLHNTWLVSPPVLLQITYSLTCLKADVLKNYVEWAATHGFGVVDVNIPHFLTGISVTDFAPYTSDEHTNQSQVEDGDEEDEILKVDLATNELAIYLWENYIECNDSTKVIFMGVGEAYKAILHILNTRNCKFISPLKLRS